MIACVHLMAGAAIGSVCALPAPKIFRSLNPSVPIVFKVSLCAASAALLAFISHFACDHFHHLEYWQMGKWVWATVSVDFIIVVYLTAYVIDERHPLSQRLCVGSGIFGAAFPDGMVMADRLADRVLQYSQPGWVGEFLQFHQLLHIPTPSYGIAHQFAIVLISLFVFLKARDRRFV